MFRVTLHIGKRLRKYNAMLNLSFCLLADTISGIN